MNYTHGVSETVNNPSSPGEGYVPLTWEHAIERWQEKLWAGMFDVDHSTLYCDEFFLHDLTAGQDFTIPCDGEDGCYCILKIVVCPRGGVISSIGEATRQRLQELADDVIEAIRKANSILHEWAPYTC